MTRFKPHRFTSSPFLEITFDPNTRRRRIRPSGLAKHLNETVRNALGERLSFRGHYEGLQWVYTAMCHDHLQGLREQRRKERECPET